MLNISRITDEDKSSHVKMTSEEITAEYIIASFAAILCFF